MQIFHLMGYATVFLNAIYILTCVLAIRKFIKSTQYNLQARLLLISIILLTPVIIFENILFIDLQNENIAVNYSLVLMKVYFALGLIGYLFYTLHILSIEDFPLIPIVVSGIFAGFGLGSMITSAQLDSTNQITPIFYIPIIGGINFILSLIVFSIIIFTQTVYTYKIKPWRPDTRRISLIDTVAIISFFISPFIIFFLRILGSEMLPFNIIFFPVQLSFILHMISYLLSSSWGYATYPDLISIVIIDMESNVVVGGFSKDGDFTQNTLHGMALIAIDNVIDGIFYRSDLQNGEDAIETYGDAILLHRDNYLLAGWFYGNGHKTGRFVFGKMIAKFSNTYFFNSPELSRKIIFDYIYPFVKGKQEHNLRNVYLNHSNSHIIGLNY